MYLPRATPANQLRGRAGGQGLPGRGSGNTGGAGRGERSTITPTGRNNFGSTRFRSGQIVRLLSDCGPNFPRGTIVEITGIERTPESATKRPGQEAPWLQNDDDSVYRFRRKYVQESSDEVASQRNGDQVIPHKKLGLAMGGPYGPIPYRLRSVVYTLEDNQFLYKDSNRELVKVPKDTACEVSRHTSRKASLPVWGNKAQDSRQQDLESTHKQHIDKCYYVLRARYIVYTERYEPCNRKKEVSNFQALTAKELEEYRASTTPPANRIVDWA